MTSYARVDRFHVWLRVHEGQPRVERWMEIGEQPEAQTKAKGCCGPKVRKRLGILCYSDCGCPVVTKAAWTVLRGAWTGYFRELKRARKAWSST